MRGTSDCFVCKECKLFDDCACTCSVGVLFHFLQAVEQVESASATRGYCAREKKK